MTQPVAAPKARADGAGRGWHVHWYRFAGYDRFGDGSLYACRCGVVRHGI